jgi:hypothetical protein
VYEILGRYTELREANERVVAAVLEGGYSMAGSGWEECEVKVVEGGMMSVVMKLMSGCVRVYVRLASSGVCL